MRSFHRWRRRSKELGYQLDVIAGLAGLRVSEIHKEIEGATDPQGPVVDLIMLRDFVETHGTRSESLERLTDAIDTQLDDLMRDARRAGRDAFRRKPRRFAKRLTRSVERDLAPTTDNGVS